MYLRVSGRLPQALGLHVLAAFAVAAVIIPLTTGGSYLFTWTTAAIWVLFALATNVIFGWTGLLSFGQAAFFGIGAYTVGVVHERWPDVPGPVLLLIAAALAGAVGVLFASGALRTRGAEFAVLTLALAQVLWLMVYRVPWLNGDDGFAGLYDIQVLPGMTLDSDQALWFYVITVVTFCSWLLWMVHRSTLGQAMRAVRDDPWRAAALGVEVRRVQMYAFALASAFSAVAGGLSAQHQGVVSASVFGLTISGEVLVACLIGGLRVFGGPVLGAIVLVLAQEAISGVTEESDLFVGLLLLLIVLVLPSGLTSLPRLATQAWRRRREQQRDSTGGTAPAGAGPAPTAPAGHDLQREGVR